MWLAFKALSLQTKVFVIGAIIVALLAITGAAYYAGNTNGVNQSKLAISEYQRQVAELRVNLQDRQAIITGKTITEYVDRTKFVDRVVVETKEVVREVVPEQYNLSNGWIYSYNASVNGITPDRKLASDANPSPFTDRNALNVIASNNGLCLLNEVQLTGLQNWIREQEKLNEEINRD